MVVSRIHWIHKSGEVASPAGMHMFQKNGFCMFLYWVAFAQAPMAHRTMTVENRVENSMSGFILLDIFMMLANRQCSKLGLPKGSLYLAPETVRNVQQVALGCIAVCLTKSADGSPWQYGEQRLSELAIEQLFGRLRTQSSSAQLTARSYWKACCRDMMRSSQFRKKTAVRIPAEGEEPLSPDAFYHASDKAMRASLSLAAFCAGVTEESLWSSYKGWCKDKGYMQKVDLLGDEDEFDDSLEGVQEENEDKGNAHEVSTQEFLAHVQAEAAMEGELEADTTEPLIADAKLDKVPDKDLLMNIMTAKADKTEEPEIPSESPTKGVAGAAGGMACNLKHALWCLGHQPSEQEVFDSIFRLVAYLRHWRGGMDRCWIKDPRASRRSSTKLNWYQCLAASLWYLVDFGGLCPKGFDFLELGSYWFEMNRHD